MNGTEHWVVRKKALNVLLLGVLLVGIGFGASIASLFC